MLDVAVAFITFNRPEPTAKSFARIREARPSRLFLVSDAARPDRPGEADLVNQTRAIAQQVDWPCDVQKIYAAENMGCGRRISSAITEAFQSVDRLIVLEDDCVANASFFPYCAELLDRYQDDDRVMAVTGDNFQQGVSRTKSSYYFSKYMHCWGWATWRRAWQHFQLDIPTWPSFRDSGGLAECCDQREIEYWTGIFDRCHAGNSQSWAYPWLLCCWMNKGLTAIPDVNLVTNIGFGEDATHTRKSDSSAAIKSYAIDMIVHPNEVVRNVLADQFTDQTMFSGTAQVSWLKRWRRKLGLTSKAA